MRFHFLFNGKNEDSGCCVVVCFLIERKMLRRIGSGLMPSLGRLFASRGLATGFEGPPWTPEAMVASCKEHTLFSWSAQKAVQPIPMVRGEGIYFWDAYGKRYTDMASQLVCVNIGHGHPKVIEAIQKQAAELVYAGPSMATAVRAEIGPLLAKHTPGDLKKFFFTLGGAEANENAIKFARLYVFFNRKENDDF